MVSVLAAGASLSAVTRLFGGDVSVEAALVATLLAAVALGAVFRLGRRLVESVTGGDDADDAADADDSDDDNTPAVEQGPSYSVSYSPVPAEESTGGDGGSSGGAAAAPGGSGGSAASAGGSGGSAASSVDDGSSPSSNGTGGSPAPSGPKTGEPAPSDGETGTDTRIFTGGWGGDDGVPDACPDCGDDLTGHDDVTFCPYCGHEL